MTADASYQPAPPAPDENRGRPHSDLVRLLLTRQSVSPKRLASPGPTDDEIRWLVQAAVLVPDHGALRPWRFVRIADEARGALADVFVEAKRRRSPDATPVLLAREREKALNAPTLLAVCARIDRTRPDVPASEQYASVGAAIEAILLAAHALGYGGIMLSGEKIRDPLVRRAFGLSEAEELIGFISLGTVAAPVPRKVRPEPSDHLSLWQGPPEGFDL